MNDDKVIPIKKEEGTRSDQKSDSFEMLPEDAFTRSLIPINVSTIGRSVKQRNLFTTSGVVACDATVVSVTANGSGGNETDMKSFTLFANEWHVGMCIRISAYGSVLEDASRRVTMRIGSGLAPTTEWNTHGTSGGILTDAPWHFEWRGIVTAIGSSGTLEAQLWGTFNSTVRDDLNTSTVAINTTGPITIALTADWDGTTAGNSITIRQWLVEILY